MGVSIFSACVGDKHVKPAVTGPITIGCSLDGCDVKYRSLTPVRAQFESSQALIDIHSTQQTLCVAARTHTGADSEARSKCKSASLLLSSTTAVVTIAAATSHQPSTPSPFEHFTPRRQPSHSVLCTLHPATRHSGHLRAGSECLLLTFFGNSGGGHGTYYRSTALSALITSHHAVRLGGTGVQSSEYRFDQSTEYGVQRTQLRDGMNRPLTRG